MEIDRKTLQSLFEYKNGKLFWKNKFNNFKKVGSLKPTGYIVVEVYGQNMMAHRIVWLLHHEKIDGYIDHIDNNRSNNKIENLRIVNRTQNQWNRKNSVNNKTGIKGIRVRPDNKKYEARISVNGKRFVLGSFENLEFAKLAIESARNKFHGVYANHG